MYNNFTDLIWEYNPTNLILSYLYLLNSSKPFNHLSVIKQTGVWPPGTFTYDPTTGVEGNRGLLLGFQPWGAESTPAPALFCHETQNFSCSPKGYKPNHVQKFSIPLHVPYPVPHSDLHPLWKVHLWVSKLPSSHSSSLLQDLGCGVLSLHVVVQENMCCVTLDHDRVQAGTYPKRVASLYILQESWTLQFSIPSHSSAPSIS